jgi:AcrR family transcriptional regulator
MAAAMELIGSEGVNSLSISAIAERVGIVPSAFYRHYASKDDVLDAILEQLRTRLMGNIEAVRKEGKNAPERLKRLMVRHVSLLARNRAIPQVVFSDSIHAGDPQRKAKVQGIVSGYLSEVRRIITEGQKDGSIRKGLPPETVAAMFLGIILPTAVFQKVIGGKLDVERYVANAWSVFERGITLDPVLRIGRRGGEV